MDLQALLNEYRQSHSNSVNKAIHIICVPLIVFSTLALLWKLNLALLGVAGPAGQWINAATATTVLATVYYATAGLRPLVGMAVFGGLVLSAIVTIEAVDGPLLAIAGVIFVASWIVQLYGHEVEGAKPSFFKDLQFLLIGPLFVLDELGFGMQETHQTVVRS